MNRDRIHTHLTEAFLAAGGEYRPAGSPDDLLHGALSSLAGAVRTNDADGFRRAADRLHQLADAIRPACDYCGEGGEIRVTHPAMPPKVSEGRVCGECFTGQDEGPCFDDLPLAGAPAAPLATGRGGAAGSR